MKNHSLVMNIFSDGNTIFNASRAQVRIRQVKLAVSICDVIRDSLEVSLHLLHQPAVGALSEYHLPVVAQRNLQGERHTLTRGEDD